MTSGLDSTACWTARTSSTARPGSVAAWTDSTATYSFSAFHRDADIAAGDFVGGAIDLYDWAWEMHEQGQIATQHDLLNNTCDIDGDTAHCVTYYLFAARNRDETNWIAGGRYFDRVERRNGEWRIALRTNVIEWSGVLPTMPIPFADVPDVAGNGIPAHDQTDPCYQRPLTNRRRLNTHRPARDS
jgi:hypothetical protein